MLALPEDAPAAAVSPSTPSASSTARLAGAGCDAVSEAWPDVPVASRVLAAAEPPVALATDGSGTHAPPGDPSSLGGSLQCTSFPLQ
eukprot:353889-Chlamydomonas_euryale.AAC.1